jgi:hypothetical protein
VRFEWGSTHLLESCPGGEEVVDIGCMTGLFSGSVGNTQGVSGDDDLYSVDCKGGIISGAPCMAESKLYTCHDGS